MASEIRLYNTLTRNIEIFKPIRKGRVSLYTCGPTVYNFVHLGNFRTYIFQDILRRTLAHAGYAVTHIMNTTDIDDKTIRGAKEAGKSLKAFTLGYEKLFKSDLKKLNILAPTKLVRATEHISEMIELIERLLERGTAYEKDGSIYFSVSKFKNYGKLAHLDLKGMKAGARVDVDEYAKEDVQDFVLWKGKRNDEPSWNAPFGDGRPGWHIECSAMSMKYLGETFDMHTGGIDLVFPHHENEIAQSEGATGKEFVRHWVHGEHLLIDGKRMAKSANNFYTLRDLEEKNFTTIAYRYLALSSHYRTRLNFTWESLGAAQTSLERLYEFVALLGKKKKGQGAALDIYRKEFEEALSDDLDTPRAIATLWKLIHAYNKEPRVFDASSVKSLLMDMDKVLGLGLTTHKKQTIPATIRKLADKREEYRQAKKWIEADQIRKEIENAGFAVLDTPEGPHLQKLKKV